MKGEAAALSVRAQRCQSHYFSITPRNERIREGERGGNKIKICNGSCKMAQEQENETEEQQEEV